MASRRVEVVLSDKELRQRALLEALASITHPGGKTEFLRRLAVRGLRALQLRYAQIPTDATGSLDHIASALDVDEDYRLISMYIAVQATLAPAPPAILRAPHSAAPVVVAQEPVHVVVAEPSVAAAPSTPETNVESGSADAAQPARDWSRFRKLAGAVGQDAKP